MQKVCEVCNHNSAYAVCDECGKSVCFNCFQFQNHRRLCGSCFLQPRSAESGQQGGQPYSKGEFQATKPGPYLADMPEVGTTGQHLKAEVRESGKILKHSWLIVPVLSGVVIALLYFDQSLSRKAMEAGRTLEREVNSVADTVERKVARIGPALAKSPGVSPPEEVTAIKMVAQNWRKQDGSSVVATNLRSKRNPHGDGLILYSPALQGERPVWIVVDGQAYSLTKAAQEVTPNLSTAQEAPPSLWSRTGLQQDKALNQLQNILSE